MKLLSFLIITTFLFSCANEKSEPLIVIDKFKASVPDNPGIDYFPANSLFFSPVSKSRSIDSFERQWYSEILYNLKEPVLYNYSGEGQAIRLVWLPSFGNPVVVRLNKFEDTVYIIVKELKIKTYESDMPKILKDTASVVDMAKWQESLSALKSNNFWNVTVEDALLSNMKDGTPWFLECRLHDSYHCISRWDDGDFSSKDLNLFAKGLIEIGEKYVKIKHGR